MKRWLLRIVLGLISLAVLAYAFAAAQIEWQVRAAAREGASQLASELALPRAELAAPAADAKPVLILLHGAGLNGQMWNPVRRHLDPRLRVIALDLPGHGAHSNGTYSVDGAVATVLAAARSLAPARVVLVGDSLGGYTAMAAAVALPRGQLAGIVMAGSSGDINLKGMASGIAQSLFVRSLLLFGSEDALATRALGLFGIAQADTPPIVAAGVHLNAVVPAARALMGIDFRRKLAALGVPLLIANGSLDHGAVEHEDSYVAAARRVTRLHFENCEHGVSMRRPAEFAAAVNAFVTCLGNQESPCKLK